MAPTIVTVIQQLPSSYSYFLTCPHQGGVLDTLDAAALREELRAVGRGVRRQALLLEGLDEAVAGGT
jgi:hypothetical protein